MTTEDDQAISTLSQTTAATPNALASIALSLCHGHVLRFLPPDELDWIALLPYDDESSSPSPSPLQQREDASARRRELRASNARRRRALRKSTVDTLHTEANALEDRLAIPRGGPRAVTTATIWYERAAMERRKREIAEIENAQLKHALATVRVHVVHLDALSVRFLNTGVNMRDLLHLYTYLPMDTRAHNYRVVCTPQKLDAACQIVTQEMRTLWPTAVTSPSIVVHSARVVSRPNELAVTTRASITLETNDLERAFRAALHAYVTYIDTGWASFSELQARVRTRGETPTHAIRYADWDAQYSSASTGEVVVLEERNLTYWNLGATRGVVLRDFIVGFGKSP